MTSRRATLFITSTTCTTDTRGLFDYESRAVVRAEFEQVAGGRLFREGTEVEFRKWRDGSEGEQLVEVGVGKGKCVCDGRNIRGVS